MTRVLCCYTDAIFPKTVQSLLMFSPETTFVNVTGNDRNYARAIARHWNQGEDIILVEHDIAITGITVPSFDSCDRDWCTFGFQILDSVLFHTLGCARFSARMQAACPDIPIKGWRTLDTWMADMLTKAGFEYHIHGQVDHLHDYTDVIRNEQEADHYSAAGKTPGEFREEIIEMLRKRGWKHPENLPVLT
jgi:hypothetical protein